MGSGRLDFIPIIITNISLYFFIYKIKTRKRPCFSNLLCIAPVVKHTNVQNAKTLGPSSLNLEPEPKNLGPGVGMGGG